MTHGLRPQVLVEDLVQALQWWSDREHLSQEIPLTLPNTTITITMDGRFSNHC